jgi:hypothetical protein
MSIVTILLLTLVPVLQALRSDHRGYRAAIEAWKVKYAQNPITAPEKPVFDWDLWLARMIDSGFAILILLVGVFTSSSAKVDRATIETMIRDVITANQPAEASSHTPGDAQ